MPEIDDVPQRVDPRRVQDLDAWRSSFTAKWRSEVEARLAAAREQQATVQARLAEASYTATSRDQLATVQVGAAGALLGVTISERARRATPVQISQAVMAAYRSAARQAAQESTAIVRDIAGEKAAEQLREALPQLGDEDGD